MPNYGWRKQLKYFVDSDRRFEFRRIRYIGVRDIESQLYMYIISLTLPTTPGNCCAFMEKEDTARVIYHDLMRGSLDKYFFI